MSQKLNRQPRWVFSTTKPPTIGPITGVIDEKEIDKVERSYQVRGRERWRRLRMPALVRGDSICRLRFRLRLLVLQEGVR